MHAVEGHVVGSSVSRPRQRFSPNPMRFIPQSAPVHGAEHDWLSAAKQDDAQSLERIIDGSHGLNPSTAKRMALGRRHIASERGEVKHWHMLQELSNLTNYNLC